MKNHVSKGFTLVEIMIVVVIIGLLAAMAIPAFQKVRQSSQDKAVLNNARQLSAGADQYFLENGVSTGYSEEEATKILSEKEVTAIADVKMGEASATAWGCDLTFDYVKINADYRS